MGMEGRYLAIRRAELPVSVRTTIWMDGWMEGSIEHTDTHTDRQTHTQSDHIRSDQRGDVCVCGRGRGVCMWCMYAVYVCYHGSMHVPGGLGGRGRDGLGRRHRRVQPCRQAGRHGG